MKFCLDVMEFETLRVEFTHGTQEAFLFTHKRMKLFVFSDNFVDMRPGISRKHSKRISERLIRHEQEPPQVLNATRADGEPDPCRPTLLRY